MTEEKCECGHLKSEHAMFKKVLLKDENPTTSKPFIESSHVEL